MFVRFSSENRMLFFMMASISVLITIPFPGYIFNSIAIIMMVISWLFYGRFQEKKEDFLNNYKSIITLGIPFIITALGLIYTNNPQKGIQNLVDNLPFVFFPLCFLTTKLPTYFYEKSLTIFTYAVSASCFFAISIAFYFKLMDMGNLFFYDKFSLIIDKHSTYISLFIVLSIIILIQNLLKAKNRLLTIVLIVLQLFVIYTLSVRISIVALSLCVGLMVISSIKSKMKYLLFLLAPIFILIIYNSPNFQKRFDLNPTEFGEISDFEYRKFHWKSVFETIEHNSIWIGTGTKGNREFLYDKYKEYKLPEAIQNQYNAHNQFLEIILYYGIIGFVLFSFLILFLLYYFMKEKNILALTFLSVFLIYFMTESLLERQIGIVLFSFFMSFFISQIKMRISSN